LNCNCERSDFELYLFYFLTETTMKKTPWIWKNGQLIPWDDALTHVLTHTLHYGGGAFEGIRLYPSEGGPAIFRLQAHVDRLIYSCQVLGMDLPWDAPDLFDAIVETVHRNGLTSGYIRPIAYFGYGELGVSAKGNPTELAIACWEWGAYFAHKLIDVKVSKYRRINPDATVIDAKICGHYVNGILSSLEIQNSHYHEALFLTSEGHIAEGAGENFFIIKDGVLLTPPLGHILPGITRATIMQLARDQGLAVEERNLRLEDALSADEAFFTGTAVEVTPIGSINDKAIGTGEVGPITAHMKQLYQDVVHGRVAAYRHFLTPVTGQDQLAS
jgi:branched-chain amino acid aminotransferase